MIESSCLQRLPDFIAKDCSLCMIKLTPSDWWLQWLTVGKSCNMRLMELLTLIMWSEFDHRSPLLSGSLAWEDHL